MPTVISYKDLEVWRQSMRLVEDMYRLTKTLPSEERFGLSAQMRRAAVSIPSNIAEGYYRSSRKEFRLFIRHAFGSRAELETQTLIVKNLKLGDRVLIDDVFAQIQIIMKMLNALVRRLS